MGLTITKIPVPFFSFLAGLFISRLGDALYSFAIPWISYQLTQSAFVMGSMFAVSVLPIVVFGPIVGVVVDGWDRRRLMMTTDVLRALLVGLIPVLHLIGQLEVWHLYVISFILTALSLLFDVCTVASIPYLASTELTRANSLYQAVNQSANFAGPVLAGVVISTMGGWGGLWLDSLSFGATVLSIMRIRSVGKPLSSNSAETVLRGMKDGLLWLVRSRLNFTLSLQAMIGNFGYSAASGVLMYYMLGTLHLDASHSSLNYALIGAGGLLGSIVIVPLEKRFRRGILIPSLLAVGTLGFTIAVVCKFWLVPGIAFGVVTICNTCWNVLCQTIRQETVPSDMLGRVLAFSRVLTRLAMPLGAMVGAFVCTAIDPVAAFAVAAAAKMLEVVVAMTTRIRAL